MTRPLPLAAHPVVGEVLVPGSKSETNRALVLAALGDGPATLTGALRSRDSELMIGALRGLGTRIDDSDQATSILPPASFHAPEASIDCGLAGTVMRFVPPLALLADGPVAFHGDKQARKRPMRPLLDGIRQLGAEVKGNKLPFSVNPGGGRLADQVVIDASDSSQFISGLLLVGARLPGGLRLVHRGEGVPSRPHIDMTVAMLRQRGVGITQPDEHTWEVSPGTIGAIDAHVEPDLTNAAVFLAAGAATGGEVTVPGWPRESLQAGAQFLDVVARMGAGVSVAEGNASVCGTGPLRGIDVDLHEASELTPVVAALAAMAQGTTRITGVAHIRGHETDRLAALTTELSALGVQAQETDDGLVIEGTQQLAATREFRTHADHRLVHAAALLALRTPDLRVDDLDCVAKTMPEFPSLWDALVVR